MIKYWTFGYFRQPDGSIENLRQVEGNKFTVTDNFGASYMFYYSWYIDNDGKRYCRVTIPSLGLLATVKPTLKEAKSWVSENITAILLRCGSEDMVKMEKRFAQLVAEKEGREIDVY